MRSRSLQEHNTDKLINKESSKVSFFLGHVLLKCIKNSGILQRKTREKQHKTRKQNKKSKAYLLREILFYIKKSFS